MEGNDDRNHHVNHTSIPVINGSKIYSLFRGSESVSFQYTI